MDAKILSSGVRHSNVPESYVRPESDRPGLSEVSECQNIPVIDLASPNRAQTVQQIGDACKNYGFFQVINHGVSTEGVEKMVGVVNEFFSLPVEEKLKLYSDDPSKTMRLSTSFNVNKEKVHNWRDYLRLHCYPLDKYVPEWPSNPSSFKDTVSGYCTEVRELGYRSQELISESLGLEKDYIKSALGEQGQHMAVSFYPPCPQPELTYGLPGHTDPDALAIFLQDPGVAGLQVLKDGKWVAVNAHPNAFVISIGDQLQALSDGIYKSVQDRVVGNTERASLSVVSFLCPQDDALTSPAIALTEDGSAARSLVEAQLSIWSIILAQLSIWVRSLPRFLAQVSVFLSWMISIAESSDDLAVIWPQVSDFKKFLLPKLRAMKNLVDFVVWVLGLIEN